MAQKTGEILGSSIAVRFDKMYWTRASCFKNNQNRVNRNSEDFVFSKNNPYGYKMSSYQRASVVFQLTMERKAYNTSGIRMHLSPILAKKLKNLSCSISSEHTMGEIS